MRQVLKGAGDVARGGRFLLAHPRLLVWVVAPALTTLLVVAGVIWAVLALADPAVAWVAGHLPSSLAGWVSGLLRLVVVGGLGIAGFLVFVTVSGLLAGPFCEMLSEAVEEKVTGRPAPGFSLIAFTRGLVAGVFHALRRLLVSLFGLALVFVLAAVIPIVGPAVALAIGGTMAGSAAAYDCFDAVLARRLWPYSRKLAFLRAHRARTLGLGGTVAALLLVPGLNLVALGLGASAATLAALDLDPQLGGESGPARRP